MFELLSRVSELDSDMTDITQDPQAEGVLYVEDVVALDDDAKLGLGTETPAAHEPMSASSHIASSLGINPHTLQVIV